MKSVAIFFLILVFAACQKTDETIRIVDDVNLVDTDLDDNPYEKSKTVNGFNISVTYKPDKQLMPQSKQLNGQQNSLNFIMKIGSDGKKHSGNFLYKDAQGMGGFKENVNYFNFSIIEDVSASVNGVEFKMVLSLSLIHI